MAKATYYQRGETLDYANTGVTAIEAGTIVVIGTRVGVVGCSIAPGEIGTVHVEGCYWFDLASAAGEAVAQGTKIYLNSSQKATTTATENTLAGYAAAPVGVGDTQVLIKLNAADSDLDTVIAVVDNLTSTSETSALSAKQGKVLKDAIDAKTAANQAASVETTNPTVAEFNALLAKLKAAGLMAADA